MSSSGAVPKLLVLTTLPHWNSRLVKAAVQMYFTAVPNSDGTIEYRVRGTYGGNITDYIGPTAAQTADMVSIKLLLNAAVSESAKFMTIDIKDFYLGTPMEKKEYMRIHHYPIGITGKIHQGLARQGPVCTCRKQQRNLRSHPSGPTGPRTAVQEPGLSRFSPYII